MLRPESKRRRSLSYCSWALRRAVAADLRPLIRRLHRLQRVADLRLDRLFQLQPLPRELRLLDAAPRQIGLGGSIAERQVHLQLDGAGRVAAIGDVRERVGPAADQKRRQRRARRRHARHDVVERRARRQLVQPGDDGGIGPEERARLRDGRSRQARQRIAAHQIDAGACLVGSTAADRSRSARRLRRARQSPAAGASASFIASSMLSCGMARSVGSAGESGRFQSAWVRFDSIRLFSRFSAAVSDLLRRRHGLLEARHLRLRLDDVDRRETAFGDLPFVALRPAPAPDRGRTADRRDSGSRTRDPSRPARPATVDPSAPARADGQ